MTIETAKGDFNAAIGGADTSSFSFTIAKDPPKIIEHVSAIPPDVRAAMLAMLGEAHELARGREAPSDGYMNDVGLSSRRVGDYALQASFLTDVRFEIKDPHVVVHAFQGGMSSKGSVSRAVDYSPGDLRALKKARLANLRSRRDALNTQIENLCAELGGDVEIHGGVA